MSLYDRIFKPHVYTLADGTAVEEKRSRAPLILLVLIALTVLSAVSYTHLTLPTKA